MARYEFENGIHLETPAEVKAYIRGLEMARLKLGGVDKVDDGLAKIAEHIEHVHVTATAADLAANPVYEVDSAQ